MKYQTLIFPGTLLGISIILIALLFVFQIIELKDLALNLISILLLTGIAQYFFQKYLKILE